MYTQTPSSTFLALLTHGCPCGYFSDPKKTCVCTPNQIQKYISKISGPLLDRIDIHIEVPAVSTINSFPVMSDSEFPEMAILMMIIMEPT